MCIPPRIWSPRRAAHHGDLTPQRQTAYRGVKIKIFTCLWLLSKGQSGEFRLGFFLCNERKSFKYKMLIYKEKLLVSSVNSTAHCTLSFCDRISRRNRNRIRNYFRLFIRGPESWKNSGNKSCNTLPLKCLSLVSFACDKQTKTWVGSTLRSQNPFSS